MHFYLLLRPVKKRSFNLLCVFGKIYDNDYFDDKRMSESMLSKAPRWGAVDAEIKVVRTQSLNVLPLKPGVGQYVDIHAMRIRLLPGISSLPISTLPVHSPEFFPTLSRFFLCWLWLTHGTCVGPQNRIGHPAGGRFPC